MDRDTLRSHYLSLPVYDTHTHLRGAGLPAADFWDIGHYFWFIRELQAAGYPEDPMALASDEGLHMSTPIELEPPLRVELRRE